MVKPLALTSGEPAGIGPDITIKAWLRRDELKLPAFYWLGDPTSLDIRIKALGANVRYGINGVGRRDGFPAGMG